jgi:hypothetical protein
MRLAGVGATARDRVATTAEFATLPKLALEDALPHAPAGCVTARDQEIRVLDWGQPDLRWARSSWPPTRGGS